MRGSVAAVSNLFISTPAMDQGRDLLAGWKHLVLWGGGGAVVVAVVRGSDSGAAASEPSVNAAAKCHHPGPSSVRSHHGVFRMSRGELERRRGGSCHLAVRG